MKNNRILLVSPSSNTEKRVPKVIKIPEIALGIIASLTPKEFDVDIVEEETDKIDFDHDCEIVGISCMTANSNRAYDIADEFKKRGKTVVFGGIHPTVRPDEALAHGDSVVIGEAEGSWTQLLKDYEHNQLKKKYYGLHPELSDYPYPILKQQKKRVRAYNIVPILTTKGCPYKCSFCSIHNVFGNKIRHMPIDMVVDYIVSSGKKTFIFVDDNIMGYPKYAKELFRRIKPLNIRWVGQSSVSFVKDYELMELARESGCKGLFFGLETVSKSQLNSFRKNFKKIEHIEEAIKKVQNNGIIFMASLVFGFDDDKESVFDETLEFLMKNKVQSASINILTPYPKTQIYKQFKEEGRLLTENWKYYDTTNVVYQPKNISPEKLAEEYQRVKMEYYGFGSILKRLTGNLNHPLLHLLFNLAYRNMVHDDYSNWEVRMDEILRESASLKRDTKPITELGRPKEEKNVKVYE